MDYLQDTGVCLDQFFDMLDMVCEQEMESGDGRVFTGHLQRRLTRWRRLIELAMASDELMFVGKRAESAANAAEKALALEREKVGIAEAMRDHRTEDRWHPWPQEKPESDYGEDDPTHLCGIRLKHDLGTGYALARWRGGMPEDWWQDDDTGNDITSEVVYFKALPRLPGEGVLT